MSPPSYRKPSGSAHAPTKVSRRSAIARVSRSAARICLGVRKVVEPLASARLRG
jgi:hypothetical protein